MGIMENMKIALRSVRSNLLRAILTLLIIAVGIMCLVGILTAVDSIAAKISGEFSSIGANAFDIKRSGEDGFGRRNGRRNKRGDIITFRQANDFKLKYDYPSTTTVFFEGTGLGAVKYKGEDSNPNVSVMGVDENYLLLQGYDMEVGRYFTATEAATGRNICVVGRDIINKLFDEKPETALGEVINVGNLKYKIVGVLKEKGSGFAGGGDRVVMLPLFTAKVIYGTKNRTYNVKVSVKEATDIDAAMAAATPVFRNIRKLKVTEDNDFTLSKSDGVIEILEEQQGYLRVAAIVIGFITLLGASVGLMNIMLVSVTERTREIGVRKSLGATNKNILTQFLVEAIVICQMGGVLGVILGLIMGNVVASLLEGIFIIPWGWIILSFIICILIGLGSGIYPAMKASRLDPIEALRFE